MLRSREKSRLLPWLGLVWILVATPVQAGITDPAAVLEPPPLAYPPAATPYNDPVFGTSTARIANGPPIYSELQAWNADMSLILTGSTILDARTFQVVHEIDWGWPDWGEATRWSPVDPFSLYYVDETNSFCANGGALMRYRLIPGIPMTRTRELVACFPEYTQLMKNESYEEMSDDGRYIALIGRKPKANTWGWVGEAFVYDVIDKVKHRAVELPVDPVNGPRTGDHIAMTPSGRYVVHFWAGGKDRYRGTEAYDLEMNYLGKVHTGSTPHSALHTDAQGNDWLIADNASNSYLLSDKRYIVKAKIPVGVLFDANGNVDQAATVGSGATVPLLDLSWHVGMHISGTNRNSPGWIVASTYIGQTAFDNGWGPFYDEVFKVHLDSSPASPHVERLAHHRSHYTAIQGRDNCSPVSNYWAQPHATVSPDGKKILFGSNWGRICDPSDPVDGFVLTLTPQTSGDVAPPGRVSDLTGH